MCLGPPLSESHCRPMSIVHFFGPSVTTALASTGASVWIRRHTWRIPWERLATLQVVLQCVALLLVSRPAQYVIGAALHTLTGLWHLDTLVGQCLYVVAAAVILAAVLRRIADDDHAAEAAALYINPVVTLAIPIMCCLFLLSDSPRGDFYADIFELPCDFWLNLYWLIFCGTTTYLLGYAIRAHLVARRDLRHQRACDMRIAALGFVITACAVRLLTVFIPAVGALDPRGVTMWVCVSAGIAVYALSLAHSWRAAMAPVRAIQRAAQPGERPGQRPDLSAPPL